MKSALFKNRLNAIVAYKFLHNFAVGLISVFIPIYFAQGGLQVYEVFGIMLVQAVTFAVTAVPVGKAVSRLGVNRSFILSSLVYVLLFASIQFFQVSILLAVFAGILNGLGMAFHWIPLNSEFTESSEEESRSKDYGKLEGVPSIISPLAPLIGAVIISGLGFFFLILASLAIVLVSILPLLAGEKIHRPDFSLENSVEKGDRSLYILYFLDGFASVPYTFIFPLFVYFAIGGTINTGIVAAIAGISSGVLAIVIGYLTDRIGREKVLISGVTVSAFLCLFIPFLESSFNSFLISFFLGLGYMAYTNPLVSMIADIGEERELLGFFSVREIFQNLGRIVIVGFLVASLYLMSQRTAFLLTFYLNAVSLLILGAFAVWIGRKRDVIS